MQHIILMVMGRYGRSHWLPKTSCLCEVVESFRATLTLTFVNVSYLGDAALLIKLFCKRGSKVMAYTFTESVPSQNPTMVVLYKSVLLESVICANLNYR
jgi:hypothetical protein